MNVVTPSPLSRPPRALRWLNGLHAAFRRIPASLPQLLLRITVAIPFWNSGLTKWDGFLQLSPGAEWLFANEFRLHLFGQQVPYPFPGLVAWMSGIAELILPALLVLGLGTRLAAAGLLAMTLVIQLTIPDGWLTYHLPWAAMLFAILVHGPGRVSLDQWLRRRYEA